MHNRKSFGPSLEHRSNVGALGEATGYGRINQTCMALTAGTRLGPYEILAAIGAGGMGEVYRARDSQLGREVAIKILPDLFAHDPERLARFHREAKLLASLNHPNIAQIYGVEDRALVMELVEGENLKVPLPLQTALTYARQIAEALEAAHEKGIVHRDLKPANVKVTPGGVVKVLDFGLAKAADGLAASGDPAVTASLTLPVTSAGMVMGTAAYMSPEQAQGSSADPRADIWSFGAVLYEMLTGTRAFPGKTVSDTLVLVLTSEPDWTSLPATTPASVRKLMRQCLRKDRKQRLQAIGDARIVLEEVLAGETPYGASPAEETPVAGSPRSFLPWAVAGLLAAVAAAGWWIAWQATRPVDHPLVRLSVDLGPNTVHGNSTTASISPDGTRLAFLVSGPDGKPQLATRLLDQTQTTVLAGTEGAFDPFFKPNGDWIGFFAEGKLKKVSVRGGAVVTLCDAPDGRGATWGEDDNIIATLHSISGVSLSSVPAAGGMPQTITNPAARLEATHRWPQLLPGGQTVLFTANKTASNYDNSTLEVLTLKTGVVKVVQSGGYFGRYLATSKGNGYLVYVHQGTLFGVSFDLDRLETRGTPALLVEDIAGNSGTAGGQFDFSRSGTFVYMSGKTAGFLALSWLDSSGKAQQLPLAPGYYADPRLSPDGKRLVYSNGTDIEMYDFGRGTTARLTFTAQAVNFSPMWTRDGTHIIFESQGTSDFSLQWIRADGSGEAQWLLESKTRVRPYSLSPHDGRLAFSEKNPGTGADLWTLPLDLSDPDHPKPGQPEPFLRSPFNKSEPAYSPDGRWMAYSSDESGQTEIYAQPFPGGGPSGSGKVTVSTGGGTYPFWSQDGRQLFYLGPDNRIMTIALGAKGDSFSGKASLWTKTQLAPVDADWNMDLASDGKRFLTISRATDAAGESKSSVRVNFLLNFFDEVRRRIPQGN